jgi:ferrous iron transport protein B
MLVLFAMLAVLEDIGYMSRIAFIMDMIFRKFGLSGKSFIPMLIGSGCSVPGIMASRTIENERDRRMTILTTSFIPCGAKMPVIGLISGALFGGAWWMAPSAYFTGVAAVIISGLMLKKTRLFAGDPAPFVLELPPYHKPTIVNVFKVTWERGLSFIQRAGTVILLASVAIWFLSNFGFIQGRFSMVSHIDLSILATIGNAIAPLFAPLGFGKWEATVATIMGLLAKEEIVGVFGVLFGIGDSAVEDSTGLHSLNQYFTQLSAYSFLLFNLLCAPCFSAMAAIGREMRSGKWAAFAIGYLCVFAYAVALIVYQIGTFITTGILDSGTIFAFLVLFVIFYLLLKPDKNYNKNYSKD